jgi:FkbM family methyltransferase
MGIDSNDHDFFYEKIDPGTVVFDVGANKGQLTLHFAHIVGKSGKVIAIEPVEELTELIRQNARLNDLSNVEVVGAAASSKAGEAEFEYPGDQSTQGMLKHTEPEYVLQEADTISVRTIPLDNVAQKRDIWPDMIKADVEGGRELFLREQNR